MLINNKLYHFFIKIIILPGLLLGLLMPLYANDKIATAETLTQLTSKWVELKKQINEEIINWKEEKAQLQEINQLLVTEIADLKETIKKSEQKKRGYNKERLMLLEQKKTYEKILAQSLPVIEEAEKGILQWQDRIPQPFRDEYKKLFIQVKKGARQSLSHRLQRVLSIYAKIEHDQSMIHLVKEVIKNQQNKVIEFDVMYFGFAQGLAISMNNKVAGLAKPGDKGWVWSWDDTYAAAIRTAIDYYQHKRIADFIDLPIDMERK